MNKQKIAVVGGGFRGIISAHLLSKNNHDVTLIEAAPFIGGVMRSQKWKNYVVDNGVHLFDSICLDCAEVVKEIMDGDIHDVGYNYASFFNDKTTPDLAIPDYTTLDKEVKEKILYEICENLSKEAPEKHKNLYSMLEYMYGKTAANIIDNSFEYIYKISSKDVEPSVMNQTTFHRLRFLDDAIASELKKQSRLDDLLAVKRKNRVIDPNFVSIYPGKGGMLAFCEKSEEKLEKQSVKILKSTKIKSMSLEGDSVHIDIDSDILSFDKVIWAGPVSNLAKAWKNDSRLTELLHKTPMVLFAFETKANNIEDFTYFHQFDPSLITFRPTSSGPMSHQIDENGNTFVVAECPTNINSELWNEPEKYANQSWKELIKMGLVKENSEKYSDFTFFKAKQTYTMPKSGSNNLTAKIKKLVDESNGKIILPNPDAFLRREIFWAIRDSIKSI